MRASRYLIILLVVLYAPQTAKAQSTLPEATADSLWAIWSDAAQADTSRLKAMHDFIVDGYLNSQPDSAQYFAQLQYAFAERKSSRRYMASALNTMGICFMYQGDMAKALDHYRQCLMIREEIGDLKGSATSLSNIGVVLRAKGDYLGALDHYQRSLVIRERIGDNEGIAASLNNIGNIYGSQGLYPLALDQYQRSLRIREEGGDEPAIAGSLINMGNMYHALGDEAKALDHYARSLAVYERLGNKAGIADCLVNIGTIHASLGDREKALEHFERSLRLSEEMGNRAGVAVALNNLGNIRKDQGDHAMAMELYQRSLRISEELGDKDLMASTKITIGTLHHALRAYLVAESWCKAGLRSAEEIGAIDQQQAACECLYHASKAMGFEDRALAYHERMLLLGDSLQREEATRKLQRMEFAEVLLQDSIAKAGESQRVQEAHAEEVRSKNRTRNILIGLGLGAVLLAGGSWNRLRNTRRAKAALQVEKDRSEDLLLNILPAEIAAELKEKGRAEARAFDQVSVLFTDFKDFTEASAQLSAQDLVAEINVCFEAFDAIVERHGIEKIKTIGDAYMVAGGLPIPAPDAAKNTVLAALAMQDFIAQRRTANQAQGRPAFEMRVGIHTGTVVAGIVGVKKFQYDIWGDVVNTASRMERSGEVGRVNISADTYALVKDVPGLRFSPRGLVEAKGKGGIEMFFVERSDRHAG